MSVTATIDARNTNSLWASVLVETLVRCAVRQAVVLPGARSTPLSTALASHPRMEAAQVPAERPAAFFAPGLTKQRRRPVALVGRSGTGAANYLPAVVEAH